MAVGSGKNPLTWRITPVLITVALVLGTLALWWAVRRQEQAHFEHVVRLAAESINADIVDDMQRPIGDLTRIAELWDASGAPSQQQFELHSSLFIGRDLGCIAVAWVSASGEMRWAVPSRDDNGLEPVYLASEAARDAFVKARSTHMPVVSRSSQYHNHRLLSVWAPIYMRDVFQGSVVGLFRVEPLLNTSLIDSAGGYQVAISDGDEVIYSHYPSSIAPTGAQLTQVSLPGITWTVTVWPENGQVPAAQSLSNAVLGGGLILALLGALITFLAQKAHWAAEVAEGANQRLTQEVVARRRAEESLHVLSGRILKVQDEERQNLARILHEGLAQKLFGLSMNLKLVSKWTGAQHADVQTKLQQNIDLADECVCEMRAVTHLLHPPSLDVLGLMAACETLAQGFQERTGIEVSVDFPEDLGRLSQDVEMALFRIVQECLTNIHRHSGSTTALVRLTCHEGLILLEVKDRGRGMNADREAGESGVGIGGMRERMWRLGGELQIETSASGTTIRALLPHATTQREASPTARELLSTDTMAGA